MMFVAKDRLSYRFPVCGAIHDFDTRLDAMSGRLGAPVAGLYTVYMPLGHAPDTPLESVAITPWRTGTTITGNDPGGYVEFKVYQVPTVETRREDDLETLALSPRINLLRDYEVIELEIKTGSISYMRPIILAARCYWDNTTKDPVWLNVRELMATLMFEGQTNVPEQPPTDNPAAIFEVYKGRQQAPDQTQPSTVT
jgi:hypothetical protein